MGKSSMNQSSIVNESIIMITQHIRSWVRRYFPHRRYTLSPQEGYDCWAAEYDTDSKNPVIHLEEQAMIRFMPPLEGKRVLDVGCGTGRNALRALEQRARCVVAMDLSGRMLQKARQKGVQNPLRADLCALPVKEAVFDVAVCTFMLEHVRDFGLAIRELSRVIVPGGVIVLTDFHPFGALFGWERSFHRHTGKRVRLCAIERTPHFYEEYVTACRTAGLVIEEVVEPKIDASVRPYFEAAGSLDAYERCTGFPLVLLVRARKIGPRL